MKTVVIDAGHGGIDGGGISGIHYEKYKNLRIALELGDMLKKQGFNVIFTRTMDEYMTLNKRIDIENDSDADLCLSLHMDFGPASYRGMSIWLSKKAPRSMVKFARDILSELKQVGFESNRKKEINKGFKGNLDMDYAWNKKTISPSMILDLGFITNESNRHDMDNKYAMYAKAICRSICKRFAVEFHEEEKKTESIETTKNNSDFELIIYKKDKIDTRKNMDKKQKKKILFEDEFEDNFDDVTDDASGDEAE